MSPSVLTWMEKKRRQILCAILLSYMLLGGMYLTAPPVFEKPDEHWHFAYITYILDHHALPPLDTDVAVNPAEQIAGHPPLYYALASTALKLTGLDNPRPEIAPNPFWAVLVPGTVNDNKNHFIHPPHELTQSENRGVYFLRLLSLLIGAGTVIGAYAIASGLGAPIWLRLVAAAGVAWTPQYLFIATSISNDALVAALSAFAMATLLKAIQPHAPARRWVTFAILTALAGLTKTSGLMLVGVGIIAGVAVAWRERSWKKGLFILGSIALALATIGGWWYARNTLLFHDPLGIHIHHLKMAREVPLPLGQILQQWKPVERSFWAAFGWGNVLLPDNWYWVFRLAELIAIWGLGLIILGDRKAGYAGRLGFWLLLILVAGGLVSLGLWTMSIKGSLGRLLFSIMAALMVLLMLGLARIHRIIPFLLLTWLAILALGSPVVINRAYRPQTPNDVAESIAHTQGPPIQFDDIARLITYHIQPDHVWPRQAIHVTLCWEALQRTETPYALFIQVLGQHDTALGYRASYPGRGNAPTTFWTPGDIICGEYQVRIKGDAAGPFVYPVILWLYSIEKDERLPATIAGELVDPAEIGRVKIYGANTIPVPETGPTYDFADHVTLMGYEWPAYAHPGDVIPITLYWQATGTIHAPYTVFIHLVDAQGHILAQADAQPHNHLGAYPMNHWDPGEIVQDVHPLSLPPDIPPGTYTLRVGLYRLDTLARVPLTQGGDSVELGHLEVR